MRQKLSPKEEAELWNKADSSDDLAAVESYLSRYPRGRFIIAASAKLKLIQEEEAKGPATVRPQAADNTACPPKPNGNTPAMVAAKQNIAAATILMQWLGTLAIAI